MQGKQYRKPKARQNTKQGKAGQDKESKPREGKAKGMAKQKARQGNMQGKAAGKTKQKARQEKKRGRAWQGQSQSRARQDKAKENKTMQYRKNGKINSFCFACACGRSSLPLVLRGALLDHRKITKTTWLNLEPAMYMKIYTSGKVFASRPHQGWWEGGGEAKQSKAR